MRKWEGYQGGERNKRGRNKRRRRKRREEEINEQREKVDEEVAVKGQPGGRFTAVEKNEDGRR